MSPKQKYTLISASILLAPILLGLPQAALAQETPKSATSRLAEIALPSGAVPQTEDAVCGGLGRLLGNWAKERELTPTDSPAEVAFWSGSAYRAGRSAAIRSALQRSLTAAGYTVQNFDKSEVRTSPFEDGLGLGITDISRGALAATSWDKQDFFVATNTKKKQTLVGFWLDQENEKRLVLALAPAGFNAPAVEGPLPAPTAPNTLLIQDPNDAMRGVALKAPAFPAMASRPGHARGRVKDGNGKPLKGAKVVIESSIAGGFGSSVTAITDANGVYDIVVPIGACRVAMSGYTVRYNGRGYALPLHPADGECEYFNAKTGHVENLILRTYGVANKAEAEKSPNYGGNYYGAPLRLWWLVDDISKGGTVEVTLTPQGPLADGTVGKTLIARFSNKGGGDFMLNDLPLGRYRFTARLLEAGEAQPLRAKITSQSGNDYADSVTLDFKSESADFVFSKTGGIERLDLQLNF